MCEEEMKTMTLSLAALLAALLTLAVQVAPAEAVYKGKCEHWLKAAQDARARSDWKGEKLADDHYHDCTLLRDWGADVITAIGIGISSYGHGGHGHGHNNHNH